MQHEFSVAHSQTLKQESQILQTPVQLFYFYVTFFCLSVSFNRISADIVQTSICLQWLTRGGREETERHTFTQPLQSDLQPQSKSRAWGHQGCTSADCPFFFFFSHPISAHSCHKLSFSNPLFVILNVSGLHDINSPCIYRVPPLWSHIYISQRNTRKQRCRYLIKPNEFRQHTVQNRIN